MTEESCMWKIRVKTGDCEVEVVGSNKDEVKALFENFARYSKLDM
jgi:hypothetical protein